MMDLIELTQLQDRLRDIQKDMNEKDALILEQRKELEKKTVGIDFLKEQRSDLREEIKKEKNLRILFEERYEAYKGAYRRKLQELKEAVETLKQRELEIEELDNRVRELKTELCAYCPSEPIQDDDGV